MIDARKWMEKATFETDSHAVFGMSERRWRKSHENDSEYGDPNSRRDVHAAAACYSTPGLIAHLPFSADTDTEGL